MLFNNVVLRCINTLLDTPIFYVFITHLSLHSNSLLPLLLLHSLSQQICYVLSFKTAFFTLSTILHNFLHLNKFNLLKVLSM